MRGRRFLTALRFSPLPDEYCLPALQGCAAKLYKLGGVTQSFQISDDDFGASVLDVIPHELDAVQARLIADADDFAKAQAGLFGQPDHRITESAALADHADRTRA